VAPYCVNDQYFESQRLALDRDVCRRELGIPERQPVFMFSGKLIARKRPLLLVRAIEQLRIEGFSFSLIILGDGPERSTAEGKLRPLLGPSLIMPGFVNQSGLGSYYRAADVFVLPSVYETWGLVVNEAMHFGLPCIVSDRVGCGPDLVIPNQTGCIFIHDDPISLAGCLRSYLVDPTLAVVQGASACERIRGFTTDRAAEVIASAIEYLFSSIRHKQDGCEEQ